MDFETWYKAKTNDDGRDDFWTKVGLESAWDAAIDSAIKTITDSSDSGESLYLIGEIKELKK